MKTAPKPVLVTESVLKQVSWQDSIDRIEELKRKDREYGAEVPMKCGEEVQDLSGRVGILTHKEFLYRDTPTGPGHDVWQLVVQYKAECKTFTNPSALKVVRGQAGSRTQGC